MAIGASSTSQPSPRDPVREGFGRPHNLFLSRLFEFPNFEFRTFFDYGCPSCYISSSLANQFCPYLSVPSEISGIGGVGPKITHDVIIKTQFFTSQNTWSAPISFSAGVLPDNTFPGDLSLGQTMFHYLGLKCNTNGQVTLSNLPYQPSLIPLISSPPTTGLVYTTIETNVKTWHHTTPDIGLKYGKTYFENFPSLFDKALRQTNVLSKTKHRIDTGNHPPIKLPPRRYSPQQTQAIRDLCKAHEGSIIEKSTDRKSVV